MADSGKRNIPIQFNRDFSVIDNEFASIRERFDSEMRRMEDGKKLKQIEWKIYFWTFSSLFPIADEFPLNIQVKPCQFFLSLFS